MVDITRLVGYIPYPASASVKMVLLITPTKYGELTQTLFVKTTDAYSYHFWRPWYNNGSYSMMAKSTRALELHYPIIQFLINNYLLIVHEY